MSIHSIPSETHLRRPIRSNVVRCNDFTYQSLDPSRLPIWRSVLQHGIVEHLFQQNLIVDTTLVEDRSGTLLRHAALPVETHPHEWCPPMLLEAARVLLNVNLQLARRGFVLNRIGSGIVQFEGPRAVVADLSSLVAIGDQKTWLGHAEFAARFLYPLALMCGGHDPAARMQLAAGGVSADMLRTRLPKSAIPESLMLQWRSDSTVARLTRPLRRWARRDRLPRPDSDLRGRDTVVHKLLWAREELERIAAGMAVSPLTALPTEVSRLNEIIASLGPARILQWGGAHAIAGVESIVCTAEPAASSGWYWNACMHDTPWLPLVIDLSQPLPQGGKPALQRLRSDLMLVTAKDGLLSPAPSILNAHLDWLLPWTRRWFIVHVPRDWPSAPMGLLTALRERMSSVVTLTPDETTGQILLCEK